MKPYTSTSALSGEGKIKPQKKTIILSRYELLEALVYSGGFLLVVSLLSGVN